MPDPAPSLPPSSPSTDASFPRRVLVTGASGMIGRALRSRLVARGVEVVPLRRAGDSGPRWDPNAGSIDAEAIEGFDAVVHLAGESIARRFTARHRERVLESRRLGTGLVAATLAGLRRPPRVLVSSSAIGIYADRGDDLLDESSAPGSGFLADVATVWERETAPAAAAGIRVVCVRTGLVLAAEGGALAPMLLPARLGLGGPLGNGRQWWSWIALDDLIGLLEWVIEDPRVRGPVNATAPEPARQADFAQVLGRVLGRPAWLPAPAFALRLALGRGMADELVLASTRALPRRAIEGGFRFRFPELEPALRHVLRRGAA